VSGEKDGRREAMDRITGKLIEQGFKPDAAKKQARDSMIRSAGSSCNPAPSKSLSSSVIMMIMAVVCPSDMLPPPQPSTLNPASSSMTSPSP
jgi:hypothetical protein